jgi:HIV Tat-specific factor 1
VLTGKPSDALDVFKNAIAAVEAGAADDAPPENDAAAADGAGDRAATQEELEFEDDDGTMYRWDHKLRKYVPAAEADAAAAAAAAAAEQHAYDVEAMTFVAEEEVIPTLAAARAAEEAAAAALEGKQGGGNKVCVFMFDACLPTNVLQA